MSSSGYFLVRVPDNHPLSAGDLEELENFAVERLHARAEVRELEREEAIAAGACDACPVECFSCSGGRESCECYEHDSPEPDPVLMVQQLVPSEVLAEQTGRALDEVMTEFTARVAVAGVAPAPGATLKIDICIGVSTTHGTVTISAPVVPS